ncbi:NnrS family protein [Pseudomonas sp. ABC1]|uniref:NnrS family protein n=1 Tax=Pseudomonas sp. ABC1 TaxID=2748080 RepID=UPI0015C2F0E6|nr:NnrS family protein [Pseudomonas sp. ABC1]QLF92535.1 NnrS family protein [Pseudomonas sp. ABC1]
MKPLALFLSCGFRPFFLLTASSAALFMLIWLMILGGWLPGWNPPGGSLLWHAHELLFGFAAAATAGFALTAVPEFTNTPQISGKPLLPLIVLWLLARLGYLLAPLWPELLGLWPVALCNLAFWLALLRLIAPRLWRDSGRRHISFAWIIATLAGLQVGFFISHAMAGNAMDWLRATTGAVMILIIIATSRISMSVLNGQVEEGLPGNTAPGTRYLARPPRRNLAIFCIVLCGLAELVYGPGGITGWTALAVAAAMFNLLNDWHIGRPLFTRWALMMYASYWLIGLGYAAMGLAWLTGGFSPSAGRHLLTSGAMALSIFAVMNIAGRIHNGNWLDRRLWLPACAIVLCMAALLRLLASLPSWGTVAPTLLSLSGLLWAACFAVYCGYNWIRLSSPREDGQDGCATPREQGKQH